MTLLDAATITFLVTAPAAFFLGGVIGFSIGYAYAIQRREVKQ